MFVKKLIMTSSETIMWSHIYTKAKKKLFHFGSYYVLKKYR